MSFGSGAGDWYFVALRGGASMAAPPFPLPKEGASAEEVLKSLGAHFKLAEQVVDTLLKSKIESLDEFRYFFDEESKIEPWISKINLGEDKNIQAARLRRAWASVRLFFQQAVPEGELRDAKLLFWRRYKLRFPPELHPSDSTVSRVAREMEKRMLCVYNLWKVKSLQFQLHCTQKKRKLGDGLYTDEVEDEEPSSHDADAYLDKLHTLLIAYAIAGASPLPGAPAAADEAALGADSTLFVAVPLDVAMSYYLRAKRTSNLIPAAKRLAWLQARDAEERAEWVSRFREGTSSLGSVIRTVYLARDAHWIPQQSSLPAEMLAFPPVPAPVKSPGLPSQVSFLWANLWGDAKWPRL